jgi:hypothetical protein
MGHAGVEGKQMTLTREQVEEIKANTMAFSDGPAPYRKGATYFVNACDDLMADRASLIATIEAQDKQIEKLEAEMEAIWGVSHE